VKFHLLIPGATNKISSENRQSKSVYKKKKEDEINLFFDFKEKIAFTPDNH